ncbi:MAG: hypothetical protein R2741_01705 [Methanolobus sp.]
MLKIGLIGCGTIGTSICKAIDDGTVEAELLPFMTEIKTMWINSCPLLKLKAAVHG